MSFRLLLCLSSTAMASQPFVPRHVWSEPVPLRAVVGMVDDCVLLHSSHPSHSLIIRNYRTGVCHHVVSTGQSISYWVLEPMTSCLVGCTVGSSTLVIVHISQGYRQEIYEHVRPILATGFNEVYEPIVYDHINGSLETCTVYTHLRYAGHKAQHMGQHWMAPSAKYLCDISTQGNVTLSRHRSVQVAKDTHTGYLSNPPFRCFWTPDGRYCILTTLQNIYIARCSTGENEFKKEWPNISAVWVTADNKYFFFAQQHQIIQLDSASEQSRVICTQAPAPLISLAVNHDLTTFIGITHDGSAVLWQSDQEVLSSSNELFGLTAALFSS